MTEKFLRVYKKLDLNHIKKHLLIYGDLSGNCANCQAIDVKLEQTNCPQCQTPFLYIAFRNVPHHYPKLQKLSQEKPQLQIVDHDDYKRLLGAHKAEEFLK